MTIEDNLDRSENWDRETIGLRSRVGLVTQANSERSLAAAKAQLRFQEALFLLRDLDEEMHLARCDLWCAYRRMRSLLLKEDQLHSHVSWQFCVQISWTEFRNSLNTYRLFAIRAFRAMRAARTLIFLRTR
jgi:hypothetical protein